MPFGQDRRIRAGFEGNKLPGPVPGGSVERLLNAVDGFIGDFSLADLENACPTVSRDWIRALLKRLRKEGKVEATGKGRYARWRKI